MLRLSIKRSWMISVMFWRGKFFLFRYFTYRFVVLFVRRKAVNYIQLFIVSRVASFGKRRFLTRILLLRGKRVLSILEQKKDEFERHFRKASSIVQQTCNYHQFLLNNYIIVTYWCAHALADFIEFSITRVHTSTLKMWMKRPYHKF